MIGNNLAKPKTNPAPTRLGLFSLTNQVRYGLLLFVALSLLLAMGAIIFLSFQAQQQQLEVIQQERGKVAAQEINAFTDDLERKLSYLARTQGLTDFSPEIQRRLLEGLIRNNNAYETLAILDETGQVVLSVSPFGQPLSGNLADTPLFLRAFRQQEEYAGPVEFDPDLGAPIMTLAVPIRNEQDVVAGVLLARVNLEFLWSFVTQTTIGETGYVYVIDYRNFLIAETGSTLETFKMTDVSELSFIQGLTSGEIDLLTPYQGLRGVEVLGSSAPIYSVPWQVIVELPTAEAYAPLRNMLTVMGVALLLAIVATISLSIYFSRQIVRPLQRLTEASAQISAGNMEAQVNISSQNELGVLATTFNKMTTQLKDLYATLEQQVASRTQRLEIVASLSERLSSILKLEDLLAEVVNQIKDKFDYYHAHIYLLDDEGQNLVVAEGVGAAGAEMKAKGHSIPLQAQTSLVARAARTGEIVTVDNVRQAQDWLPNPLLPNTYSEMAVPITLGVEGRVVGVLDVQEDEIGGLDEGDENLLRSLANQVAVAIRNARLFDEVETALAKAYAAQEHYVEQSWENSKIVARQGQYHYTRPNTPNLSEPQSQALAEAKHQVLQQSRLATVDLKDDKATATAVISPVILHNRPIGALQIYPASENQAWTEDDLAIIEAVVDQLAQTAENLRLFDETRQQAARRKLLSDVGDKLRRANDMESLLKLGLEEVSKVLKARRASVRLGSEAELTASQVVVTVPTNGRANGQAEGDS